MDLDNSVNILKNIILKLYDESKLEDENSYFEYNFLEYKFIYDNSSAIQIDLFCKFFVDRIILNAINYNYFNDDDYNHLLHISICDVNDTNREEKIVDFFKIIYNLNSDYTYSKIVDKLVLNSEKHDLENEILAKSFLKHSMINECSVCNEQNSILTKCNHNLCRICHFKIKRLIICPLCPICRSCLDCNEQH